MIGGNIGKISIFASKNHPKWGQKSKKNRCKKKTKKREVREGVKHQLSELGLWGYLYKGRLPWKPPLLKPGTVGHQNKDSCMNLFNKFLLDCLVGVLGHFGGSIWLPWNAFGLICALLGHLLASFWLFWGVLERLLCPSWPKFVQDNKKSRFF